jgi:hypothetical protein
MGVYVKFGPGFYEYTNNQKTIEVSGDSVRESIDNLVARIPIFKELLFDQEGSLSALIFYKGEVVVQKQLEKRVEDHQELLILPMINGG